jgi:hypothetical protein
MNHSDDKADPRFGDAAGGDRAAGGGPSGGEGHGDHHGERGGESTGASRTTGSSLSSLDDGLAALAPFLPSPEAAGAPPPRGRFTRFVDFASNAAFVACVLGFAFAAGTYFFGGTADVGAKTVATVAAQEAERAELARTSRKLEQDIGALKANVEALRASVAQAGGQRGVEKSLDALKTRLEAVRAETGGQLADLAAKVDRLQRDPALQQVVERLDRIEKQTSSMLPTGSVAPLVKAATQDRGALAAPAKTPDAVAEAQKRPTLITSWVVRDVYDGVALVENARGAIEVALGDTIPGAGTVKAIERRGGGWVVITSRGLVDYDHSIMVP